VTPTNDAPTAVDRSASVLESSSVSIELEGNDIDGDALTFQVVTTPAHGSLSGSGASRFYTPFPFYHGPDSFTFVVRDGITSSAPATVTITVIDNNVPPTANPLFRSLNEDTSLPLTLSGSDPEFDFLTFAIATQPAHGTLSGTPPFVTYTPAANYNGSDSFTYTAFDGTASSTPAAVSLTITSVLDPPVAIDGSATTVEDTPVAITLQATDVDSATLTFSIVSLPTGDTVTGSGANRTYTPAPNATGTRTFLFSVSDGNRSATGAVTVVVTPVNDPPTPRDDYVSTDPGTPLTVNPLSNDFDVDGDTPLTLHSVAAPAHGAIEMIDGQLLYTPDPDFSGVDVFEYTIADPAGVQTTGSVRVGVGSFPEGAPTETIVVAGGSPQNDSRRGPAISGDGRYLAVTSPQPLVAGDTNGFLDIYLYDRGTRTLTRASTASGGGNSNGASMRPYLSVDGRYVVFESNATNLVAGDTNGVSDVFRYDRVTGTTVRVSVATGGGQASGASVDAEISDDGNLVVFSSSALDLVANDANGAPDVFLRDLAAGTTTRISISLIGGDGDLDATEPTLSGDGRYVAFTSLATNLVTDDSNGVADIFLRDRVAGTTTRISVGSTGGQSNDDSFGLSLSRDGRFVSFVSFATNLVPGVTSPGRPYVRDRDAQTTTVGPSTVGWVRLSGTGRYQALLTDSFFGGVSIRDRFTNTTVIPVGASNWLWPTMSSNGRYVVVLDTTGKLIVAPNPL
jgi:Tol biopolymer transport system component